jgi:hypothetical protein
MGVGVGVGVGVGEGFSRSITYLISESCLYASRVYMRVVFICESCFSPHQFIIPTNCNYYVSTN